MEKVNIGIVGLGASLNYMYAPIIKYLKKGKIVAAMDPDRKKLNKAKTKYRIERVYKNFEEIVNDKELDALIIASPVQYHKEQVLKAADKGKHILCEKR